MAATSDIVPIKSEVPAKSRVTDAPFLPGERVTARYVIERVLAEGGMGIVVAARHQELDETVAIKFLKPEFARSPEVIGRFAREAKAALRIKCEYIATVFDVGVTPDRGPYIVMEYLRGDNLATVLATEGRLPVDRSVEIVLQACEALATAHANGIVHRDVKPENVFIVKRDGGLPIAKVLDFGVSKAALAGPLFGGAISLVKTQSSLGSPLYMSPEQLRGKDEVDARTDIWSLGALLYEMLTGRVPFEGASITEVCAAVLETEPRPIKELAPMVGPTIGSIVMKCLEKSRDDRYQTIAELAVALAPFAPKRARLCVERAIAVSKSAGLIGGEYTLPASMPPSNPPTRLSGGLSGAEPLQLADVLEPEPASAAEPVSSPEPPPPPPARSGLGRSLVLAALFAVLAAGIIYAKDLTAQKQVVVAAAPAATTAAPAAAAEPPASETATGDIGLSIVAKPNEAKLFLDDALLPSNPFKRTVPRDRRAHAVRVEAPGYVTRTLAVTYDADVEVNVTLEKGRGVVHTPVAPRGDAPRAAAAAAAPRTDTGGSAAAPAATPVAVTPPASTAPPAKANHEMDLPKSNKPVRGLDTSGMW